MARYKTWGDELLEKGKLYGIEQGIEQGIEKGKFEGHVEIVKNLKNVNFQDSEIIKVLGESEEYYKRILEVINK